MILGMVTIRPEKNPQAILNIWCLFPIVLSELVQSVSQLLAAIFNGFQYNTLIYHSVMSDHTNP